MKKELKTFSITNFMDLMSEKPSFIYAKTHKEALSIFLGIKQKQITSKNIKGRFFDYSVRTINNNGSYSSKDKNYNYYIN